MTETRKYLRLAIFNGPDQRILMSNYTVNMSTGGVFIESDNILPVDTPLVIKFNLPDNDIIITCNARVAWTNEPGHLKKLSFPSGMGIQFLDLSLENLQAIRILLKEGEFKPIW
jgi:uncharacterized protein (TIGR02266 family)